MTEAPFDFVHIKYYRDDLNNRGYSSFVFEATSDAQQGDYFFTFEISTSQVTVEYDFTV
jgi:hypothetical protein